MGIMFARHMFFVWHDNSLKQEETVKNSFKKLRNRKKQGLFTNYTSQCQGQPRDKQGQSRDKHGQGREKQGHSLFVPACPCLSLSDHACPFLSLYVHFCPCLSLSVHVCLYICNTFMSTLQMNITVFISKIIVTLTFLAKATVPMRANLVFNFFFTFHLASSITLSFNPNGSIRFFSVKYKIGYPINSVENS